MPPRRGAAGDELAAEEAWLLAPPKEKPEPLAAPKPPDELPPKPKEGGA